MKSATSAGVMPMEEAICDSCMSIADESDFDECDEDAFDLWDDEDAAFEVVLDSPSGNYKGQSFACVFHRRGTGISAFRNRWNR